jgi:FMN-dependent oxidoreductase (nitrilotriacetate monooxygenase family)
MIATHAHRPILNANLIPGGTLGGVWRRSERNGRHFIDIDHYVEVARIAERGRLDAVFLADVLSLTDKGFHQPDRYLDPLIAQAVIAAHTEKIGLIVTGSTTYNEPYNLARQFASLDAVSRGRAGWNFVVTSNDDAVAQNYSQAAAQDKAARYARAAEFIDVVTALWSSWKPGALVADKANGVYVDPARLVAIDHVGKHFQVKGPLKAPPLEYGQLVLIQAGASPDGVDIAGRYADAVYSSHDTLESALERRHELRARAAAYDRDENAVKLLPGLVLFIGSTDEEAARREIELIDLTPDDVQANLLAEYLEVPRESVAIDGELPWRLIPDSLAARRRHSAFLAEVRRRGLNVREAARLLAAGNVHAKVVGGPERVADFIEEWFRAGAVDGFNVLFDELPSGLEAFVDYVVPILRRRDLYRHEYEGSTLRQHYGLDPVNISASAR